MIHVLIFATFDVILILAVLWLVFWLSARLPGFLSGLIGLWWRHLPSPPSQQPDPDNR